ncbi:MAG: glycosyltransferase family 2 protein [Candidatus Omnitrophica bacterium]|nr:glycosyltransferase family 2 protein [Candidatus Omnitrophota bacterium]
MAKKILAIIPAYNEAKNIGKVVRELQSSGLDIVPLVVDDGSADDTAEQARMAGAAVVSLPFNLGIGGAVQTGYRWADENGYEAAVQIDGDGQHDPAFLAKLVRPISEGAADMSVGSRFCEPADGFRSSRLRRIGIRFFVALIRLLTGLNCSDPTSGFRAVNRKLIRVFAAHYPQDFPEPEAIVIARRLGARITEVPVVMRPRSSGKSSIGKLKSPYYMIKVTGAIMLDMFKDRKVFGPWE